MQLTSSGEMDAAVAGLHRVEVPPAQVSPAQGPSAAVPDTLGDAVLSRARQLYLQLAEMQTIQQHFAALGREPTDIDQGIGLGPGKGATPQMADAQGGSGNGVGIRELLPCLEGEQFGSVAGLHVV